MIPNARTVGRAAMSWVSLLVFALCVLLATCAPAHRSTELSEEAVRQFHNQLDSGKYAEIYDAADEQLKRTTSEAGFANVLQSVHEKLGNVRQSSLSWSRISWHGQQRTTVRLMLHTNFTSGTGDEDFVWQINGDRVTLGSYKIKSNVLTTK